MFRNAGIALVAGAAIFLSASGCKNDDCSPGESRCDGAGIVACGSPGDVSGSRGFTALSRGCGSERCLDVVENGARSAVCSTTGAKDPRCEAGRRGAVCVDGRTLLVCELGYSSGQRSCGACIESPGSTTASAITICAVEATENPVCKGASNQACDKAAVVECLRGWVIVRRPCAGASPTCVLSDSASNVGHAYCARQETCGEKDNTRCEADGVRGCVAGSVVSSACDASEECRSYTTKAQCEPRCQVVRSNVCLDP